MEEVIDQVRGILVRKHIDFRSNDSDDEFYVSTGSALITVRFRLDDDGPCVCFVSNLLMDIDLTVAGTKERALEAVNEVNAATYAVKFVFYEEGRTIAAEHEILAARLQAVELLDALDRMYRFADNYDDVFKEKVGSGVRAEDRYNQSKGSSDSEEIDV